jgi:single-strand DNA-binding protein
MSAVNKVILVGNVGKEPEIATVGTGARVAKFSLATSERWTDKKTGDKKESTEWHSVVVWNEALVGVIERYVRKGSKLYLEGAIKTRKWQGKDGQDKYSTEIVLQGFNAQMVMLDGPSSGSTGRSGRADPDGINQDVDYAAAAKQQVAAPKNGAAKKDWRDSGPAMLDDEIPFSPW